MTVEEAVVARLQSLSAVTALVSTRIYLEKLPQSPTYPCVRVQLVSDVSEAHLRGGDRARSARVQVDAFAQEKSGVSPYALAAAVADAVNGPGDGTGLEGWTGELGSPAFEVLGAFRLERRRQYDPEELRVLTMSQDYQVHYRA